MRESQRDKGSADRELAASVAKKCGRGRRGRGHQVQDGSVVTVNYTDTPEEQEERGERMEERGDRTLSRTRDRLR